MHQLWPPGAAGLTGSAPKDHQDTQQRRTVEEAQADSKIVGLEIEGQKRRFQRQCLKYTVLKS